MESVPEKSFGNVLLVDDDDQFREAFRQRLGFGGYVCCATGSVEKARELLREFPCDVIISDIRMAGNAGLEFVASVKEIAPDVPVVLLTGHPTVETAALSVRLRVAAYLVKPPNFSEVKGVLDAAIINYRSLRALKEHRKRLQDWDREVERMVAVIEHGGEQSQQSNRQDFLRFTLRSVAVSLVELDALLTNEAQVTGQDDALARQDLLNTIRKTIGVLAETRSHFKSKALGELRKELEAVISRKGPDQRPS